MAAIAALLLPPLMLVLAVVVMVQEFPRVLIVLGLLLPLSSGQYEGLGRYCSVLFPLPILLGSFQGEHRHHGLMTGFAMFYALGLILFGNVHPLF